MIKRSGKPLRAARPRRRARMQAAVFLDKDGTLIENVPYNVDPARVVLTFGAARALRRLSAAGFKLIVVSNQPGVAQVRFERSALRGVEERIQTLLAAEHVAVDDFRYCPHLPAAALEPGARPCRCRKPAPGLLHRAARRWRIDLARSWLVGDILDDVEAGRRAGCSTVLIANGNETEWKLSPRRTPDGYAHNLWEAANFITQGAPPSLEGRSMHACASARAPSVPLVPQSPHERVRSRLAEGT